MKVNEKINDRRFQGALMERSHVKPLQQSLRNLSVGSGEYDKKLRKEIHRILSRANYFQF